MRVALVAERAAIVTLAVLSIYRFAVLPLRCTHVIARVERRTENIMDRPTSAGAQKIARDNVDMLRTVSVGCTTNPDLHLLLAFNLQKLGDSDGALQSLADALRVDERPEIYFDRGIMLLDEARVDDAVKEFAVAGKFNPLLLDTLDVGIRDRVRAQLEGSRGGN